MFPVGDRYLVGIQSGQFAESGSQTRLPDAAVLSTILYGSNLFNLKLQLHSNPNLTPTVIQSPGFTNDYEFGISVNKYQ